MTRLVSFPGLGLEFHFNHVAFQLGSISIYWYSILATTGILLGVLYALKRSKEFGLDPDKLLDLMLFSIFAGLVGARLYYVAFSWDTYKDNLLDIFKIYEGGIAIYGALIGGAIMAYYLCKKYRLNFLAVIDVSGTSLLLGQAIGRWGNFVNIEAFGSNTSLPWGMTSPNITAYLRAMQETLAARGIIVDPMMPVHPTFLYESIWCFIGFGILAWYTSKRRFDGELALFYAIWNGSGRFVIEGLRSDSLMLGNIRVSQVLAAVAVVVAVIVLIMVKRKIAASTDPTYLQPKGKLALMAEASPDLVEIGPDEQELPDDNIENTEEENDGTVN